MGEARVDDVAISQRGAKVVIRMIAGAKAAWLNSDGVQRTCW